MEAALFLTEEEIIYQAPSIKETGTVRYAASFTLPLSEIKLIGYVPRVIVDNESGFIVLVSATGSINYFNLDVADKTAIAQLKGLFNFKLEGLPDIAFEKTNWHSFIIYPQELTERPLFKAWSWITPRGFLKNLSKEFGLDNPMWERLTDEAQAYLIKNL